MKPRHIALAFVTTTIWGVNFVVIDKGMHDFPPILFTAIRFTLVALPLIFFVKKPNVSWGTLAAVGTFVSLGQYALLYLALSLGMPAGLSSVVLNSVTFFTVIFGALILREMPTRRQVLGIGVGIIGLSLVATGRFTAAAGLLPLALIVLAAISWGYGNTVVRRARADSPFGLVIWSSLFVPLPLYALSLVTDGPATVGAALGTMLWGPLLSSLFTAYISTIVGFTIWNRLLATYTAGTVTPYMLWVPVVGMAAAWLFNAETPTTLEIAGAAIMLSGIAVTSIHFGRRPQPPRSPDTRPGEREPLTERASAQS